MLGNFFLKFSFVPFSLSREIALVAFLCLSIQVLCFLVLVENSQT